MAGKLLDRGLVMPVDLYRHQQAGVDLMRYTPRYAFFWECGTGKTMMILAALSEEKKETEWGEHSMKTVVVCPLSVMETAWLADAMLFDNLCVGIMHGGTKIKRTAFVENSPQVDVWITTYETFRTMTKELLAAGVKRIVVDESSKIKNHKTKIADAIHKFADKCDSAYLLSGTPAPNCRTEYWSQMRVVDRGLTGTRFYSWAYDHFDPVKTRVYVKGRGGQSRSKEVISGWQPKVGKWDEWIEKMSDSAWVMRADEAIDLPPETDLMRSVLLTKDERAAYDLVEDELLLESESGSKIDVSPNGRLMKLRQLAGGFAYGKDGEEIRYGMSKVNEVVSIAQELGNEKFVVWAEFSADIDLIAGTLRAKGVPTAILDGRQKAADRSVNVEMFQHTDKLRAVVCHPASVAHGITLTAARHAVFYGLSYVPELYHQARKRIHRIGQDQPCFYTHLVSRNTVDSGIIGALSKKLKSSEAVKHIISERRMAKT